MPRPQKELQQSVVIHRERPFSNNQQISPINRYYPENLHYTIDNISLSDVVASKKYFFLPGGHNSRACETCAQAQASQGQERVTGTQESYDIPLKGSKLVRRGGRV